MLRPTVAFLLLAGCAADTRQWHTVDGRSVPIAIAEADWLACRGELAKVAALGGRGGSGVADDIVIGCMAGKGYVFR